MGISWQISGRTACCGGSIYVHSAGTRFSNPVWEAVGVHTGRQVFIRLGGHSIFLLSFTAFCCLWFDLGSIWNPFGIDLGSIWGQSGIDLGSIWGHVGINSGLIWDEFGVDLGSIWDLSVFEHRVINFEQKSDTVTA